MHALHVGTDSTETVGPNAFNSKGDHMNQRSLHDIVGDTVRRAQTEGGGTDEDALLQQVLADPDMRIIMDGYRMHDRSGDLEAVIERDVRKMIQQQIG
jgi:hypothetical protein